MMSTQLGIYDDDNKNTDVVIDISSNKKIKYQFDSIVRIKSLNITDGKNADGTDKITVTYMTYNYNSGGNVESIVYSDGSKISYTYDKNGNIETITEGTGMVKYFYNNLDELKGEEYYSSSKLVKKLSYSYDAGGNIKEKSTVTYSETGEAGSPSVISYLYNDSTWKDLLTSYNGQSLSYDTIGNLTDYAGYSYAWEGRELKSITGNGLSVSFKYNSDGIRTEKALGNSITKYYLVGDKVTYQETIDSNNSVTDKMYFIYDAAGKLVSMELDGVRYDYIRNAQDDITGLMDMAGNKVVSYSYDSWGKLQSIEGSLKDSLGVKNPYRYRGYRYDTETGLYYLQSRYYNPEWGRFINADVLLGYMGRLLSHNIFAYCRNNPVRYVDRDGYEDDLIDEEGDGFASNNTGWGSGNVGSGGGNSGGTISPRNIAPAPINNAYLRGVANTVPNPNGKNGGILHQMTISNIKTTNTNGRMQVEFRYSTPNGLKSYRYADKVEIVDGEITKIYQVGKVNKNGLPVIREAFAIQDIMNSLEYNGAPIYFIPYNSSIGPIIYLP